MAIIQCPNGHFYDDAKYDSCPVCKGSGGPRWVTDGDKTVSLEMTDIPESVTVRLTAEEPVKPKIIGTWDPEKTVALSGAEDTILLTGWLVCIRGSMRGKDYRLYPGFNRIGRSMGSDICLQDPEVSRENHCSVAYDAKSRSFYLAPGQGTVYLDGELVQKAVLLSKGSRISLGSSELELIPFCEGDHVWETR